MPMPRYRRLVRRVLGLLALFAGLWVLVAEGGVAVAATVAEQRAEIRQHTGRSGPTVIT